MYLYFGLNPCPKLVGHHNPVVDLHSEIFGSNITSITGGWNYLIIFQDTGVTFCGEAWTNELKNLVVPDHSRIQSVIAGKEHITSLTEHHEIWQLNYYTHRWNKIDRLIPNNVIPEYAIKIGEHTSVLALTNLGRIFNVRNPVEMPKNVKFTDFACGLEHAIMLTDDGDIYSMGIGTKGQLGHENLEDCNKPELITALAGLKIAQVSAGGWHSAVITVEGDLYTWGWNKNGELGIITNQQVIDSPTLVVFNDNDGHVIDIKIEEIQCGNGFSVCKTDEGELWGCGSNKYGQLTQSKLKLLKSAMFVKLDINYSGIISNFYCSQFGSIIDISE